MTAIFNHLGREKIYDILDISSAPVEKRGPSLLQIVFQSSG
jgi:hypothetical protein